MIKVSSDRVLRVKSVRDFAEYRVWCGDVNSLASLLSELLSRGVLPVALGLLTVQLMAARACQHN